VVAVAVFRCAAENRTTYLLTGTYADWQDLMGGYDAGKTIMYRKLRLAHGELLDFFKGVYMWTESLACMQKIPTEFSG
jgi:putative sterol carrier protein